MKKKSLPIIKRSIKYTDEIFERCVRKVLNISDGNIEDTKLGMDIIRHAHAVSGDYNAEELKTMNEAKIAVSDMYQHEICKLTTKQLKEILDTHESKMVTRTTRTIETILNELVRRSLLNDSSESDFKSNDGDVNGHKGKSKRNSAKTPSKGSKATKN